MGHYAPRAIPRPDKALAARVLHNARSRANLARFAARLDLMGDQRDGEIVR